MRQHASVDQIKADLLNVFKGFRESESQQRQRLEAERQRRARQSIEEIREQKRLREELSNGWDLEFN